MPVFPISASTLVFVGCPRAIDCKRKGMPNEVPSDDELLMFGVNIHEIFNAINRHAQILRLDDDTLDNIIAKHISDPEAISELRRQAVNYINSFPIRQVIQSEVDLAVDEQGNPVAYDDPAAMIRGRIDAVMMDEGGGKIILDHKSGWAIYDANTFQNRLYAYLWKKNFPDTTSIGVAIHFSRKGLIRYGGTITDFVDVEKEVMIAARRAWSVPVDAEPAPGKACQYCRWCLSCPAGDIQNGKFMITTPEQASSIARNLVAMEKRQRELKKMLRTWAERYGTVDVDETTCYSFKETKKYVASLEEVLSKMGEFPSLIDVLSIDAKKLVDHPADIKVTLTAGRSELRYRKKDDDNDEEDAT